MFSLPKNFNQSSPQLIVQLACIYVQFLCQGFELKTRYDTEQESINSSHMSMPQQPEDYLIALIQGFEDLSLNSEQVEEILRAFQPDAAQQSQLMKNFNELSKKMLVQQERLINTRSQLKQRDIQHLFLCESQAQLKNQIKLSDIELVEKKKELKNIQNEVKQLQTENKLLQIELEYLKNIKNTQQNQIKTSNNQKLQEFEQEIEKQTSQSKSEQGEIKNNQVQTKPKPEIEKSSKNIKFIEQRDSQLSPFTQEESAFCYSQSIDIMHSNSNKSDFENMSDFITYKQYIQLT